MVAGDADAGGGEVEVEAEVGVEAADPYPIMFPRSSPSRLARHHPISVVFSIISASQNNTPWELLWNCIQNKNFKSLLQGKALKRDKRL